MYGHLPINRGPRSAQGHVPAAAQHESLPQAVRLSRGARWRHGTAGRSAAGCERRPDVRELVRRLRPTPAVVATRRPPAAAAVAAPGPERQLRAVLVARPGAG